MCIVRTFTSLMPCVTSEIYSHKVHVLVCLRARDHIKVYHWVQKGHFRPTFG